MKIGPRRVERRILVKDVLSEQKEAERTVAESLEFLKPGDLQLIEQIALDAFATTERDTRAAFALPGLIFTETPLSEEFKQERDTRVDEKKATFESWIAASGEVFDHREHLTALLKAAEELFSLRGLLDTPVDKPSQEVWRVIQTKVREFAVQPHANPPDWLVKLVYIDPVRFQELPSEEMRQLCLQNIAKERKEYPESKDKRQIRLLHALAATRLMFPDLVDADSLTTEERGVTREYLEKERAYAKNEGGTGFAFYVYLLSIVEASSLTVDEKGVHLSGSKVFQGKGPELPVRPEI